MTQAWAPARVLTAVVETSGQKSVEALYEALAGRFFLDKAPKSRATIEAALEAAGLPRRLADAGESDVYDQALRGSHSAGMALVGAGGGNPVIALPGPGGGAQRTALFGPVVAPAPKGAEALRLWDGLLAAAATPGFYEIKRGRSVGPFFES